MYKSYMNTSIDQIRLSEIYLSPIRIDQVNNNLIYIGYIDSNLASVNEIEPIWRIKRITQSGNVFKVQFPDGDTSFDFVWADRSLLNYK